jgi:predicted GIY-YIG superfamily endonuclease
VVPAYSEPQRSKSRALKREAAIKAMRRADKDRLVAVVQPVHRHAPS